MKKIYALLMLCLPMLGFAQKDVTFIVDMRDTTLSTSYSGVYVNGDFNSWCGTCNPLSDPEGDSVWTVTLTAGVVLVILWLMQMVILSGQ